MKYKAIFFDRDGTLIVDKHYLSDPEQVEYFPETKDVLSTLQEQGFRLFIVTNQSGVGRGMFEAAQITKVHEKMQADMLNWKLKPFADLAYCPHAPEEKCKCRKPYPKMVLNLIQKWGIDPTQSFMIGDKQSDVDCGESAGVKSYLLTKDKTLNDFLTWIKA